MDETVTVPEHARWTENDTGQIVVMNTRTGDFYGLGATGSLVWRSLVSTGSVDSACEAVASSYDIAPAVVAGDVRDLVADLLGADLLVRVAGLGADTAREAGADV